MRQRFILSLSFFITFLLMLILGGTVFAAMKASIVKVSGSFNLPKKEYKVGETVRGKFTVLNQERTMNIAVKRWNTNKFLTVKKNIKLQKGERLTIPVKWKIEKPGKQVLQYQVEGSWRVGEKVSGFTRTFDYIVNDTARGLRAGVKRAIPAAPSNEARKETSLPSLVGCLNPPSDLVAWFPANGNAREVVSGSHGAIATSIGFAEGKIGQAFSYPNASPAFDDVRVIDPGSYELDLIGPFTVEAWIKFLEEPEGSEAAFIFAKGGTAIFQVGDLLSARVEVRPYGPAQIVRYPYDSVLPQQTANIWTHVALTFDGRTIRAYRNGDMEAYDRFDSEVTLEQNNTHFLIGDDERSRVPYLLDEIRVYNRELSEAEIERIYNDGSAPRCVPVDPAPTACVVPPAGQVAWFTGDDTLVDVVGGLEGTFSSYGTYGAGMVGNAFTKTAGPSPTSGLAESMFRIDDPGTADSPLDLASFTLEGWVKFAEVAGILRAGNILHKGENYKMDSSGPYASVGGLSLVASANSPTIAANQWAHVASTYDGQRLNLYVNGALVGLRDVTGTTPRPAPVNNERLSVGYYTLGAIDELSFYNRALGQREIDRIYRAGNFGKCRPSI